MNKKILFVLIIILISGLGLGAWGLSDSEPDPVEPGVLAFADTLQKNRLFQLENFVVLWDSTNGGRLLVGHKKVPGHRLWQSRSGRSFIMGALGREDVREIHGSFFFQDNIEKKCYSQNVQEIKKTGKHVLVSGFLNCEGAGKAPYQLLMKEAPETGHLSLEVSFPGQKLNRTYLSYESPADEYFFGFGEQFARTNPKGKRLPIFVREQGVGRGLQPLTWGADIMADSGGKWHTSYASVPHYITSHLRSLFLENSEYAVFDLRASDHVTLEVFSGRLKARVLFGQSPAELIQNYTAYAGRMRPLPAWVHKGAILGLQGGTKRVREIVKKMQAAGTPIAGLWLQDWVGRRVTDFGKQLWWNWQLDDKLYPGWDQFHADMQKKDIRLLGYINPFLVDNSEQTVHSRNLYKEAQAKGYLVKTPEGKPYDTMITSFSATLVDLTNPEARKWLKQVLKDEMLTRGFHGWMADFGEALPYDAVLSSGVWPGTYHNTYPEEWARLNRELIDELKQPEEYVFFTRSGYTRSPRYSTLFWTGDQTVTWDGHDGIKTAVRGVISGGISGYSLNHSDIGGYTTVKNPIANYFRSKELLWRWMELSAFHVVFRTHEGNLPDVNHQVYSDPETIAQFARCARIFRALAPYRKKLIQEAARSGMPPVRHLFLHYPLDNKVLKLSHEQFLFGDEYLIAPITDPDRRSAQVYLPAGDWVHLWTGRLHGSFAGGETVEVPAPLGQPPVFYKKGSKEGLRLTTALTQEGVFNVK